MDREFCGLWVLVGHVMVGFGLWSGGELQWWWVAFFLIYFFYLSDFWYGYVLMVVVVLVVVVIDFWWGWWLLWLVLFFVVVVVRYDLWVKKEALLSSEVREIVRKRERVK